MKKNVGGADRVARAVIGLVILALGLIFETWWGLLGMIPLLTAVAGRCPAYLPLKISTCKTSKEEKK
jgi:hypothetical protein